MINSTKLVITDISPSHRQAFINLADTLELTRGQLLILLLVGAGLVDGGLDQAIPSEDAQSEWRDLMERRVFELAHF